MLSSFYPVVAGRTSDALSRYRSLYQVQINKIDLQRLQDELSTGRKILKPSDDPSAAIRVIGIQRDMETRTQAIRNLDSSQGYLNVSESTLSGVQDIVTNIRGLSVSAASLTSDSERSGMLTEINAAVDQIVSATNTKYQDRYLFSGGAVGSQTVTTAQNGVSFLGDDAALLTISDTGQYVAHNVTGQKALGLISSGVTSSVDLAPAVNLNTKLADLKSGIGVSSGAIKFSNGLETATIDLTGADTVGDVLERVNGNVKLSGRNVSLSLNTNGTFSINYDDAAGGLLRIVDSGTGRTAADLGIASTVPTPSLPITGSNLSPVLKLTTLLSQLNGGTGFDTTGGLQITQGGKTYNIDLTNTTTLEDIFNKIEGSGAQVRADITPDGSHIRVRSTLSGVDFSIGESGGSLATRLGIRTVGAQTPLSTLNHGRGVSMGDNGDVIFRRNDGTEFSVDLANTATIQDVIDRINNDSNNLNVDSKITAQLNSFGNGLTFTSPAALPAVTTPTAIAIRAVSGNAAAKDLGIIPKDKDIVQGTANANGFTIVGADPNPQEVSGVFNSLFRLRDAIQSNDLDGIGRASALLDEDLNRLSATRASLGIEQQQIDTLKTRQEDSQNLLKDDESKNLDADMATTISDLTGRQVAYQASLQLLSNTQKLSLFDYI